MEPQQPQQKPAPKESESQPPSASVTVTTWSPPNSKKVFRLHNHQLKDCQRYFQTKYPKQQAKHKQRKFYTPEQLKEMESKLTCGIQLKPPTNEKLQIPRKEVVEEKKPVEPELPKIEEKLVRPPLRTDGPTHFININLSRELAEIYKGFLEPTVKESLLPLDSLHATLVKFTLKKEEDLKNWESLLSSCKKLKVSVKGIGMIGKNNRYATVLYLNISGIDDIVDTIMSKGVERELLEEADNADRVRFDKPSQLYKIQQPHVKILRTNGKDLVDAAEYLKVLKDVSVANIPVTELRVSVSGSYRPGKGYYDQAIIKI